MEIKFQVVAAIFSIVFIFYSLTRFGSSVKGVKDKIQSQSRILITGCNCDRNTSSYPPKNEIKIPRNKTSCSDSSHRRGDHQKVVAFSFYEQNNDAYLERKSGNMQMNKFIEGVKINIDRIKQLYEGILFYPN